ncbi:hypothetical protein ACFOYY_21995 [Streptosporangium jomthongense]|uniref:Uncharacterized protein n=2 Tax=Streptosporangium jomthongense TaxID=1193683 RepID=A0ABV8F5V4_9ACTN
MLRLIDLLVSLVTHLSRRTADLVDVALARTGEPGGGAAGLAMWARYRTAQALLERAADQVRPGDELTVQVAPWIRCLVPDPLDPMQDADLFDTDPEESTHAH